MLLTMEMYADDCGEGAEGAGEPHIGEILGAGVSRTVGAPWRVRAGMCPRVLLRPGEMDCSALLLSVVCFEFCYATTSPVRHSRDTPPPRARSCTVLVHVKFQLSVCLFGTIRRLSDRVGDECPRRSQKLLQLGVQSPRTSR